jgi:hypothetical protein
MVGLDLYTTCRLHIMLSYRVGSAIRVLRLNLFGRNGSWDDDDDDPFYNDRDVVTAGSSSFCHNTAKNRSLGETFIAAHLCLDQLKELLVKFLAFIHPRDYNLSSLKFLRTA